MVNNFIPFIHKSGKQTIMMLRSKTLLAPMTAVRVGTKECREEMKYKLEMYMPKNKGNDIEYNGKVKGPTFSRNALATDASESILRTDTITNQDRIWAEENKKMLSNLTFGEQCKRFFWKFNDYGMWWPEKPIIAADATNSEHFSHYYEYGKKKP